MAYTTEPAPEKLEYNPNDAKDAQIAAFEAQKRLEENLDSVKLRLIFLAVATASSFGDAVLAGILHFGETSTNVSAMAASQGAKNKQRRRLLTMRLLPIKDTPKSLPPPI